MRRGQVGVALSAAAVLAAWVVPVATSDWTYLADGAVLLTSSDAPDLYAMRPDIQVGPLALLAAAVLEAVGGDSAADFVALLIAACFGPILILAHASVGVVVEPVRLLGIGLVAILPWTALAGSGHVDELGALALVLCATWAGRVSIDWASDRASPRYSWVLLSGVCSGLAAAVKPWGITTLPAPWRRHRWGMLGAGLTAIAVVLITWSPFLGGVIAALTAGYPVAYPVEAGSLWEPWRSDSGMLASWIRVPQLLTGIAACAWAASRGPAEALVAAIAMRIALDPGQWPYQFAALAVTASVLDARRESLAGPLLARSLRATACSLLVLLAMLVAWVSAVGAAAVLVILMVVGTRQMRTSRALLDEG